MGALQTYKFINAFVTNNFNKNCQLSIGDTKSYALDLKLFFFKGLTFKIVIIIILLFFDNIISITPPSHQGLFNGT
jgi:hypothetical protein